MKATLSCCPICRVGTTQIGFGSKNKRFSRYTDPTPKELRRIFMTEAGQPLIQITELTKVFYTDEIETHALSGVHLSVGKGEYVAMSGPSGCGKSTLLSIIGLLDTPTGG